MEASAILLDRRRGTPAPCQPLRPRWFLAFSDSRTVSRLVRVCPEFRASKSKTLAFNGEERVGLPWLSLAAFVRISTNPRATHRPLTGPEAWKYVADWLEADRSWIPLPTDRHAEVLGSLVCRQDLRANLITDAQIAALAIEHGLAVYSADSDFARFSEIRWINPLNE